MLQTSSGVRSIGAEASSRASHSRQLDLNNTHTASFFVLGVRKGASSRSDSDNHAWLRWLRRKEHRGIEVTR